MITHNLPEVPANLPFNSYFVTVDLSRVEHNPRSIEDCLSRFPEIVSHWVV